MTDCPNCASLRTRLAEAEAEVERDGDTLDALRELVGSIYEKRLIDPAVETVWVERWALGNARKVLAALDEVKK